MALVSALRAQSVLLAAQTLANRSAAQSAQARDCGAGNRITSRTTYASQTTKPPSATPRNVVAVLDTAAPYRASRFDSVQTPPAGFVFVPVASLTRPMQPPSAAITVAGTTGIFPSSAVRRPAAELSVTGAVVRAREQRVPRKPRKPRTPRAARKPRAARPERPPRKERKPRRPRMARKPRAARKPRRPRPPKTKGKQIPGICRIQCGGRPGACWNTGVCVSGLVPYPANIGACCFPRTFHCEQ